AGAVLPVQGAINAQLRHDLSLPLPAGVVSFLVAALAMTLVFLATLALTCAPSPGYPGGAGWAG
ncbi:MAG: hypothetical protein C4331_11635, partial [Meiothermus sp.]